MHDHWIPIRRFKRLSYQAMSSTSTQSQLCTASPVSFSVHCIVCRGFLIPLLCEDSIYFAYDTLFSNLVQSHLQPPPTLLFLFPCFVGWICDGATFDVWFYIDIMDLHMSNLGTIVPEGPWCVLYATRRQVYWGLTHNVVFYKYSDLTSHTETQNTHKD